MSALSSSIQTSKILGTKHDTYCFHCGDKSGANPEYRIINSEQKTFCCAGCAAIAETIVELGLNDYYERRTEKAMHPKSLIPDEIKNYDVYSQSSIQKLTCDEVDDVFLETELIIRGITCPACSWLCESRLSSLEGIEKIEVNYSNHRAKVRWDKQKIDLSKIMQSIRDVGYDPRLYNKQSDTQYREKERKQQLQSLGITAILGMQVMMISIALYFGKNTEMDPVFIHLFHWINLILTTPVLFISGKSFFKNAIRDLRIGSVSMDLAVSLGLFLAFIASIHATLTGGGDVYFDTIVMFVFFLSASRYIEFMLRQKSLYQTHSSELLMPLTARKIVKSSGEQQEYLIPASELNKNDIIQIKPGETIPADGTILDGTTYVNEAMLTGEQKPAVKKAGDSIVAGSINIDSFVTAKVKSAGEETVLASIEKMIEQAQYEKPELTRTSDIIASYFISGVIIIAFSTILLTGINNIDLWLERVIAVLIVSCPCALSLAMPSVYSASIGRLSREGVFFKNIGRLLNLTRIQHFIFDKTGTCTKGKFNIISVDNCDVLDRQKFLSIAAAIEQYSEHPIATAFCDYLSNDIVVKEVHNHPGKGISAKIDNEVYYIGNKDFINDNCLDNKDLDDITLNLHSTYVFLATKQHCIAVFELADTLRENINELITALNTDSVKTYLCSGDNHEPTQCLAEQLGFYEFHARMLPSDKLAFIKKLQSEGDKVAMFGDGINDAPTLSRADISFSISEGSDLAQLEADAVILNKDMKTVKYSMSIAKFSKKIIKQNIIWAISYNLIALPIAISGWLAPWMAAIGMSLSSLLVILNADRIRRFKTS